MFPELLKLGPITLKTYGFFVAVAFLVGANYAKFNAKRYGVLPEVVLDLSLYILVSGLIGTRIFYIVLNWEFYKTHLVEIFYIWSGGLVFYGGIIFAFIVGTIYVNKKKLNLLQISDIFSPAIFLALSIGRIGCLFSGCCYGKPTELPWGIKFSNPDSLVPDTSLGLKLHPTQIYESLFAFGLFLSLHFISRKKSKWLADGLIFFISVITYSIWRFFIEFLRWDDRGGMIFGLFPSQFVAIIVIIVSAIIIVVLTYQWKKSLKLQLKTSE